MQHSDREVSTLIQSQPAAKQAIPQATMCCLEHKASFHCDNAYLCQLHEGMAV